MYFFPSLRRHARFAATGVLAICFAAPALAAEPGWVGSQIQLNLRTGPGTEYRIVGSVETGDRVSILERKTKWTRVRLPNGEKGWIPVGYLEPRPPPVLELAELRKEVAKLRHDREASQKILVQLEEAAQSHAATVSQQTQRIDELTRTNIELKAGARWPEWITGAAILCTGLALGALLQRASSRRRQGARIKL